METPTESGNTDNYEKSDKELHNITVDLSQDDTQEEHNETVNLSSDESIDLLNGKTSPLATDQNDDVIGPDGDAKEHQAEVFSFVGASHTRENPHHPFHIEPPVKRPHSPEKLLPIQPVKRKCEVHDGNSTIININEMISATAPLEKRVDAKTAPVVVDGVQMPITVTKLVAPNGSVVYLVGTAHFSLESQNDVSKVIQFVQPHIVTVELCKSRISLLQLDEETILREAQDINLAKIRLTIQQNGLFNGIMYILLLSMSAHLTKQLGMAPGGEFRRAMLEAGKVPHCCVHLGDRPINITLQRALSSLSWWQTFKLTWHIIFSRDPISKEEVEKCKQRDLLEEMLAEMTGEFPALGQVFVKERDLYLAHSLALACQPVPTPAGLVPAKVVGVVGIGHVPGIVEHWGKVGEEDITPIMKVPPRSLTSRVLVFTMKASTIGLVVWGAYKILPVPRISSLPKLWK